MTELSPQAQAVLDATTKAFWSSNFNSEGNSAAATLRAAVEQCQIEWDYHPDYPETLWVVVASDLLAIATELENQ